MSWIFLSYPLSENDFGYGNGERFFSESIRSMCCGDTSNNSRFSMPTHFGTHIDFPFHFSDQGKKSSGYHATDFIFSNVGVATLKKEEKIIDYLIRNKDFNLDNCPDNITFLIVKTDYCLKRQLDEYWEFGLGFHPETAGFLKDKFKNLKAIGFDLISLNSFQNREIGRTAHKEYLLSKDILILEELDLRLLPDNAKIKNLIVAPLQLIDSDGAPCTIFADIYEG